MVPVHRVYSYVLTLLLWTSFAQAQPLDPNLTPGTPEHDFYMRAMKVYSRVLTPAQADLKARGYALLIKYPKATPSQISKVLTAEGFWPILEDYVREHVGAKGISDRLRKMARLLQQKTPKTLTYADVVGAMIR